jgi:hypothetical protein
LDIKNFSLLANYIAIVVLVLKSLFDLWGNRLIFDNQVAHGVDKLTALDKRNRRANITSAAAFAATALSIILSIGGTMNDKKDNTQETTHFQTTLTDHQSRIELIEYAIWGSQNKGFGNVVPSGPNGPFDPVGMENILKAIKTELADLTAKNKTTSERLEDLILIVNKLSESLEAYNESVKQIQNIMSVHSG